MSLSETTSLLHNFNPDNSIRKLGCATKHQLDCSFSILVWNIFKAKKNNWNHDFKKLMCEQDIAILQEAVYNSEHDNIFDQDNRCEWVMARSFRNNRTGIETGVKTGAVAESITTSSLFSHDLEPFSRTPKIALSTYYKMDKQTEHLLVLNVHAINFVSLAKYSNQLNQLNEEIRSHQGPIVLAGDFNTWSSNRFDRFESFASDCGLIEAKIERSKRLKHLNRHLDHVYYRGLVLDYIESDNSISSSDHYPIKVRFRLP